MTLKSILLTIAAVAAGYVSMGLLITLVQELWFGGVSWVATPKGELMVAGLFTLLSGFVGAVIATLIVKQKRYVPSVIMAVIVCIEMTVLFKTGQLAEPLWFDFTSAALLIVAIIAGGVSARRVLSSRDVAAVI